MDKIELKFSKKSNIPFTFSGMEILVSPIIGLQEQSSIRNVYISALFNNGKNNPRDEQFAEFMLRREVLSLKTNINVLSVDGISESEYISKLDELVWGELYEKVVSFISNYDDFRDSIALSAKNEIERVSNESSIGNVVSELIEKVKPIIDNFSNMKPEDFEKMKSEATEIVEKIKEEPIASVLSDMKGNASTRKRKSKKG